jgi:hypothetical protein
MKILLLSPDGIGDLLLFLPIVESLKNTWDCEITLAVNGEKKNLVQGNPHLNVINPEDVNSDECNLSYTSHIYFPKSFSLPIHRVEMYERIYNLPMRKYFPAPIFYTDDELNHVKSFVDQYTNPVLIHTLSVDRPQYGKSMSRDFWDFFLKKYSNYTFIQVGQKHTDYDLPYDNVVDVRGMFDIRLSGLVSRYTLTHLCMDSIIAHFTPYTQKRGIVLWGSTTPLNYGHDININFHDGRDCSPCIDETEGANCCQRNGMEIPWNEIVNSFDTIINNLDNV